MRIPRASDYESQMALKWKDSLKEATDEVVTERNSLIYFLRAIELDRTRKYDMLQHWREVKLEPKAQVELSSSCP